MGRRPIEPLIWLLFSAGGVVAALALPILVLLFGLAFPLGLFPAPEHERLASLLYHPLARTGLFLLFSLSLAHAGHRFRYTLYDGLQIKHLNELVNLLCYGGALLGSAAAGYLLWQFGS